MLRSRTNRAAIAAVSGLALMAPGISGAAFGGAQGPERAIAEPAAPAAVVLTQSTDDQLPPWQRGRQPERQYRQGEPRQTNGRDAGGQSGEYRQGTPPAHARNDSGYRSGNDRWASNRYAPDGNAHWRARGDPNGRYWVGRPLVWNNGIVVVQDYYDYGLPPPPFGYYYVRDDQDVFLVAEATGLIVSAFLLLSLAQR